MSCALRAYTPWFTDTRGIIRGRAREQAVKNRQVRTAAAARGLVNVMARPMLRELGARRQMRESFDHARIKALEHSGGTVAGDARRNTGG